MLFRFIFIFLLLQPASVLSAEVKVHERTLSNGLKVLVKEDHRSPVVVTQVWYKVGSSYEYGGITGISHMLEHMMFKGTDQYPAGEFSRIIAENGGRENAFTGADYTAYFQTLEKSRLPVSFELEADRMRNLHLLEEELEKELQVVMEERRMRTEDKPRSKTLEQFAAMAYANSPYKNPVIGWPSDIENYTVEDLQKWYQLWYAPNNAILVVVGDVVPEEVFKLAEKYFGPLKPSELKPQKPRKEMKQLGTRQMNVKLPAKLPYLVMGYKVPVLNTAKEEWEAYALDMLVSLLDGGNSARLPSRLVRGKQIAVGVSAHYDMTDRLQSLFTITATPAEGHTVADVEKALKEEIKQLQENLVSEEELDRIRAQVVASAVYERDSNFYQAMQLGLLETVGVGWQEADLYADKVSRITAEQVREVAKKYLVEDRLNIAILEPLPIEDGQGKQSAEGGRHAL